MYITHQIIRIERGETANSKSPMWRCATADGQRVNIFQHTDPKKNSFNAFEGAGYAAPLLSMKVGEIATWKTHPIDVVMNKSGEWWEVFGVAVKPPDAQPDPQFMPALHLYRDMVMSWADSLFDMALPVVIFDTETTGLTDDDEIVEIAIIDQFQNTLFHSLIKPRNPERLSFPVKDGMNGKTAIDITGITPEMLWDAPTFEQAYLSMVKVLNGKIWVVYNAKFDTRMLDLACSRAGLMPFYSIGTNCAMEMYAQYAGDWNAAAQRFNSKKLTEAMEALDVEVSGAHRALTDAMATVKLIRAMSEGIS